MSEDFKNLTNAQLASEVTRLNTVLNRKQHNPAQLTARMTRIQTNANADRSPTATTVTDSAQANIAALITNKSFTPGQLFKVSGTGDTTDNGLQAAKGGVAVVANDIFYVVSASEVQFIGQI